MGSKTVKDFFEEHDKYDAITFFKWIGCRFKSDKARAHSNYSSLLFQAGRSDEWSLYASAMTEQWNQQLADGTIASFWENLPKKVISQMACAGAGKIPLQNSMGTNWIEMIALLLTWISSSR